jgi:hypothetical protein
MKSNVMPMSNIELLVLNTIRTSGPIDFHDILACVRDRIGSGTQSYMVSAALTYLIRIRRVAIDDNGISFIIDNS